jgi:hypothetical protein
MKRKDEERKEATRRKYEELQNKKFNEIHTFQPNKNHKKKRNRSKSVSAFEGSSDNDDDQHSEIQGTLHKKNDSGIILGLDELLNPSRQKSSPPKIKKNIEKTGDQFLDRMQQYTKKKHKKEKQFEKLKKEMEDQKIQTTCTFQPNKNKYFIITFNHHQKQTEEIQSSS